MSHEVRLKDSNEYLPWRPVAHIDALNGLVVFTGPHDEALVARLEDVFLRKVYEAMEKAVALGMPMYGSVQPTPEGGREVIVAIVYSGDSFHAPRGYILSSGRMVTHLYDIGPEK